jgi:hypothetical protein
MIRSVQVESFLVARFCRGRASGEPVNVSDVANGRCDLEIVSWHAAFCPINLEGLFIML